MNRSFLLAGLGLCLLSQTSPAVDGCGDLKLPRRFFVGKPAAVEMHGYTTPLEVAYEDKDGQIHTLAQVIASNDVAGRFFDSGRVYEIHPPEGPSSNTIYGAAQLWNHPRPFDKREEGKSAIYGRTLNIADCDGRALAVVDENYEATDLVPTSEFVFRPSAEMEPGRSAPHARNIRWATTSTFQLTQAVQEKDQVTERILAVFNTSSNPGKPDFWEVQVERPEDVDPRVLISIASYKYLADHERYAGLVAKSETKLQEYRSKLEAENYDSEAVLKEVEQQADQAMSADTMDNASVGDWGPAIASPALPSVNAAVPSPREDHSFSETLFNLYLLNRLWSGGNSYFSGYSSPASAYSSYLHSAPTTSTYSGLRRHFSPAPLLPTPRSYRGSSAIPPVVVSPIAPKGPMALMGGMDLDRFQRRSPVRPAAPVVTQTPPRRPPPPPQYKMGEQQPPTRRSYTPPPPRSFAFDESREAGRVAERSPQRSPVNSSVQKSPSTRLPSIPSIPPLPRVAEIPPVQPVRPFTPPAATRKPSFDRATPKSPSTLFTPRNGTPQGPAGAFSNQPAPKASAPSTARSTPTPRVTPPPTSSNKWQDKVTVGSTPPKPPSSRSFSTPAPSTPRVTPPAARQAPPHASTPSPSRSYDRPSTPSRPKAPSASPPSRSQSSRGSSSNRGSSSPRSSSSNRSSGSKRGR